MEASEGLAAFCKEQYPRLTGLLGLYCGDRDAAQELAQEALAVACRDWKKVSRMGSPEAWAYRVAINLANSHFRRRAAERRARRRLAAREAKGTDVQPPDVTSTVVIRAAVSSLPRRQRTAIVLRYFADLSVSQVSEVMDCSQGAVKSHLHRGLAALRSQRARFGEEIGDAIGFQGH